uniref:Uncharacterized protein n=1 Tax=Setaria viridis TaxID=4556 RepID=A0A4U6T5Z5_SETVI|nr:hypothetical protein SEVIR_9G477000v2 [Setaria viridis]
MAEFIALWDLVQDVQFNEDKDQIKWKCTASGSYTSKYAYEAQFRGSFTTLEASNIWRAYTKAKHKVLVSIWSGGTICMPAIDEDETETWWTRSLEPFSKKQRRSVTAYLIMTTWNIWKERNRRVFEGTSLRLTQVFDLIQEEKSKACASELPPYFIVLV